MINKWMITLLLGVMPLLSGCATGYQDLSNPILGWKGGYWDKKGPGELIKVGFAGNMFVEPDKVGSYLLYRCAEIAQREGREFFVLYESLPAALSDRRSTEKSVGTVASRPTAYVYILLLEDASGTVLSANEVITRLKPLVKPEVKS